MRLPLIALCVSLSALTAACDSENGVRITSTTSRDDARGVLRVIDALQCPETLGQLTRKGSAQADGTVCTYSGARGAEVSLHLVALDGRSAEQALKDFEMRLMGDMPHAVAELDRSAADQARVEADAARTEADAARTEADAAQVEADRAMAEADAAASATAQADADTVNIRAPGMRVDAEGDRARVRLPGISIDAQGDTANVRIGGMTINADDSGAVIEGETDSEMVSIQAQDDSTRIHTRAPGEATRQTFILTDTRPSDAGWRLVGYEARGPRGGPIVVATVRAKDRNSDGVFDDAKDLVALNVGE